MSLLAEGHSQLTEIDPGDEVFAVTFTSNGKYLVSGGREGIRVWQSRDGKQVRTIPMNGGVECVAVSKDGQWIAAGSWRGEVSVWDGTTYEQVFAHTSNRSIRDVDFSPDSPTRLVVSADNTATIWDTVAHKQVQTLLHTGSVLAAKYSQDDRRRIATATETSVQVWDDSDGHLLVDVHVQANPWRGLLWSNNHLFLKTKDSKIKQIDASTGATLSEWSIHRTDYTSCIVLPQHGKFIAHSTREDITFWSTSTHTRLGHISQSRDKCSVAFGPKSQVIAAVQNGKIVMKNVAFISDPDILVEKAVLDSFRNHQLANTEALLTSAIPTAKYTAHHVLASRGLVRARLRQWDAALLDAEESIKIQPSVIGYVAKCAALVGKGEIRKGCRICDIAFQHFYSDHVTLLLLIKAVILFMAGEHDDAMSRIDDLISTTFSEPSLCVVQAYMYFLLGNLRMEGGHYERAILSFEHAWDTVRKLPIRGHRPPTIISLISGWKFDDLAITIQQQLCEALLVAGRTKEAGESLLDMVNREVNITEPVRAWVVDFTQRCLSTSENDASAIRDTICSDDAPTAEEALRIPRYKPLLREWAAFILMMSSWKDALIAAAAFTLPKFAVYQAICERLEMTCRVPDAAACFLHVRDEQVWGKEHADWFQCFQSRCCWKLEDLGDSAMKAQQYDTAISQYTAALALEPATPQNLLTKRSRVNATKGEWDLALRDANEAISLDSSSPSGYERKHAALYGMGRHDDATKAFETMLLKMSQSPDPKVRAHSRHYVRPEKTKKLIRTTIKDTIRDFPPVLINTISGCLCNASERASAFEMTPTFTELISSMTTHIDTTRIEREVGIYFRYATFSHKWEDDEPLFDKVTKILVYDLETSPTHAKLQMFCKIVRDAGFNWAWSDTCCINRGDYFVLQEALVCMFKWYEGSAMTLIFLRGVARLAQRGAMMRSIWNTRGWTLQEYHASKVVRFYTEDWTPYLDLDIYNHKDSPEIISEMEETTGISAQALMALRPGLDDIREKLRLASTRQTTRIEDAAYSLLGIFSLSLPITYGDGDKALGQLLAQLLTSSGDLSILAWTGRSGSFNSSLPASITVFSEHPTSHIPDPAMESMTAGLRSLNLTLVMRLYDRLDALSVPVFLGRRMKLPCLTFKLGPVIAFRDGSERVYRAQTAAFGIVNIRSKENLSELGSLCLVHPWIDFLLDRQPVGGIARIAFEEIMDDNSSVLRALPSIDSSPTVRPTIRTRTARLVDGLLQVLGRRSVTRPNPPSLSLPSTESRQEKRVRALQFVARLRQPFGALLLAPMRRNMEYRRVAADSLITVQIAEITSATLESLIEGVQMLDVL